MKRASNPAQGVLLGCLIGACLWLLIGMMVL